jgi:hypothetical protein
MRSPVEYEADHAAGDPDGLARTSAREKSVHNLRLVRRETGMRKEMRELYIEGLAIHGGPESCVSDPRGRGEALTGVRVGWAIEPRNGQIGMPTPSTEAEGHVAGGAIASRRGIPRGQRTWARTESSCMGTGRSHGRPWAVDDAPSWMVHGVACRRPGGPRGER